MLQRLITICAVGLAATVALATDEGQRCAAPAKACEQQIRALLLGMPYFGAKLHMSRWGLVIDTVVAASPAGRAGFRTGDRIFAVNGRDATKADVAEFKRMLAREQHRSSKVAFAVVRGNTVVRITAKLDQQLNREQVQKVIDNHVKEAHPPSQRAEKQR